MNRSPTTNGQFETDTGEFEAESPGLETGDAFEFETEVPGSLDEIEEMELAAELLAVTSDQELDQFLGKLFKSISKGVRKIAKGLGPVAGPLGGLLKGLAKKALPFVGGALGSLIPIPGVGTAVGTALGGAASKLLEVDLEGMNAEDQEFELARRFVRLAGTAAAHAAHSTRAADPRTAALQALQAAVAQLAAGSNGGAAGSAGSNGGERRRARGGHWYRRGKSLVLVGA